MHLATAGRLRRGRLAVTAVADLALMSRQGPVPLERMGRGGPLTPHVLEQLMSMLLHAGLLRFTRGRDGGWALARDPADITVADIVMALQEGPDGRSTFNAEAGVGDNAGKVLTGELWDGLDEVMLACLRRCTLQELLQGAPPKAPAAARAVPPSAPRRARELEAEGVA